nr:type II secretion system protein GspM [Pseudomonas sp. BDAL1]
MWQPYVDRWRRLSGRVRVARAGLSIRETRLLSIGALVLCCLVTWLLMVQPALKKITYWQAQNPVLSAQARRSKRCSSR